MLGDLEQALSVKPLRVALALRRGRSEAVRAWLAGLATLSRADAALTLRVARICAWFKGQDLAPLGYPTFSAFVREEVDFDDRWLRGLIRLVESRLDLVKEAVCRGIVPIRLAVAAPSQATPETEEVWLARAVFGRVPLEASRPRVAVTPAQVRDIRAARKLARLLRGSDESVASLDAWILERWRTGATADDLLDEAYRTPPKPELDEVAWCEVPDPATAIVGVWRDPSSLEHALELLAEVQELRRATTVVLGVAWDEVVQHRLWQDIGLPDADALAKQVLGTSARSMQRHRRLGRSLGWHDAVRDELRRGALDLDRAEFAMDAANLHPVDPWVELARRVPKRELRVIRDEARQRGRAARAPYESATSASGELIAVPPAPREEPPCSDPAWMSIDPDLPEAAAWLLDTVEIPRQRGFGIVKELYAYVCQNPLCGRRGLRNHAHHHQPRALGGSDDPSNGLCHCSSCHLRLIHAGLVLALPDGDDLLWFYPRGKVVRVLGAARRMREVA